MELKQLPQELTVCKVERVEALDLTKDFYFLGKTEEEISLVCATGDVPDCTTEREVGFRGFRIQGSLDFSLVGILSRISGILAAEGIGIFAVSTYNTDYILVKKENFDRAWEVLGRFGYTLL